MKKILIGVLAAGALTLYPSCQKDGWFTNPADLLLTLAGAPDGTTVAANDLPDDIINFVESQYAPLEIAEAWLVEGKGYTIVLEDGTEVFFDLKGAFLGDSEKDGLHEGAHEAHSNTCKIGQAILQSELPQAAIDYLATQYDAAIEEVVIKPNGHFSVVLSDGTTLLFDAEGSFIKECVCTGEGSQHEDMHEGGMHHSNNGHEESNGHHGNGHDEEGQGTGSHVHGGTLVPADQLPAPARNYIDTHYPDAAIEKVVLTYHGKYFVELAAHVKLVFDAEGNILYDSGN